MGCRPWAVTALLTWGRALALLSAARCRPEGLPHGGNQVNPGLAGFLREPVLPAVQKKFAETYRAAGGQCQYEEFEGCEHEWVAKPGPQTDRAREMVKRFIARQLA